MVTQRTDHVSVEQVEEYRRARDPDMLRTAFRGENQGRDDGTVGVVNEEHAL